MEERSLEMTEVSRGGEVEESNRDKNPVARRSQRFC